MFNTANCSPPIGIQPEDVIVSVYTAAAIAAGTLVQFDFTNATTYNVNETTSGFGSVIASTVAAAADSCRVVGVMLEASTAGGIGKVQTRGIVSASILGGATKGNGLKIGAAGLKACTNAGDSPCAILVSATLSGAGTGTVLLLGVTTGFGAA